MRGPRRWSNPHAFGAVCFVSGRRSWFLCGRYFGRLYVEVHVMWRMWRPQWVRRKAAWGVTWWGVSCGPFAVTKGIRAWYIHAALVGVVVGWRRPVRPIGHTYVPANPIGTSGWLPDVVPDELPRG